MLLRNRLRLPVLWIVTLALLTAEVWAVTLDPRLYNETLREGTWLILAVLTVASLLQVLVRLSGKAHARLTAVLAVAAILVTVAEAWMLSPGSKVHDDGLLVFLVVLPLWVGTILSLAIYVLKRVLGRRNANSDKGRHLPSAGLPPHG